jgi:hypothetical protein
MPAVLDECVQSMMAGWKKDPSSRPTPKKGKDGEPMDAKSQAHAICTASLKKAGKMEAVELEWNNPVVTGMALTNRPHIKFLDPVSLSDDGGEMKVPLIILGKWRHAMGVLDFTSQVIDQFVRNFQDNIVGHDLSVDNRHKPELGAMGWVSRFGLETRQDGKKQFSAYATPTPTGKTTVEERRYRYGSIEFYTDWTNPLIAALSSDDLEPYVEEATMPDETVTQGAEMIALEQKLKEALIEVAQLKASQEDAEKLEAQNVALSERLAKLEQQSYRLTVDKIMLEAENHRDEKGRAHSAVFLDWVRAVLLEQEVGEEGREVKLEDRNDPGQIRAYYRKAIAHLVSALPGVVPMTAPQTEPDKDRPLGLEQKEPTLEVAAQFWEVAVDQLPGYKEE